MRGGRGRRPHDGAIGTSEAATSAVGAPYPSSRQRLPGLAEARVSASREG